ncbi:MAG: hypothetical protein J5925_01200 [Clostridia bacterium]|nr:hypothetical protein [Clostridia bacterium]
MKKFRPILGISLCIQSLTFFILALINIEKKKALAATFAVLGAAGGAAGGVLLYNEIKERKSEAEFDPDDYLDNFDDDFDDCDICEDDIVCTFEDDKKEEAGETAEKAE